MKDDGSEHDRAGVRPALGRPWGSRLVHLSEEVCPSSKESIGATTVCKHTSGRSSASIRAESWRKALVARRVERAKHESAEAQRRADDVSHVRWMRAQAEPNGHLPCYARDEVALPCFIARVEEWGVEMRQFRQTQNESKLQVDTMPESFAGGDGLSRGTERDARRGASGERRVVTDSPTHSSLLMESAPHYGLYNCPASRTPRYSKPSHSSSLITPRPPPSTAKGTLVVPNFRSLPTGNDRARAISGNLLGDANNIHRHYSNLDRRRERKTFYFDFEKHQLQSARLPKSSDEMPMRQDDRKPLNTTATNTTNMFRPRRGVVSECFPFPLF